jgi:hypothetical protein
MFCDRVDQWIVLRLIEAQHVSELFELVDA